MKLSSWGEAIVVAALILACGEVVRGFGDSAQSEKLPPEVWAVAAGVLVSTGISLEQLRRVRADVKDIAKSVDANHGEVEHVRRELVGIKGSVSFIRARCFRTRASDDETVCEVTEAEP